MVLPKTVNDASITKRNKERQREFLKELTLLGFGLSISLSAQLLIGHYTNSISIIEKLTGVFIFATILLFIVLWKGFYEGEWYIRPIPLKKPLKKKIQPRSITEKIMGLLADKYVGTENKQYMGREDYLSCSLFNMMEIKRGYQIYSSEYPLKIIVLPRRVIISSSKQSSLNEWVNNIKKILPN